MSYDALAPYFQAYARVKAAYLDTVDRLILQDMSPDARSLLDIGSGDGLRAARLAAARSLSRLVLSDPSDAMVARCREQRAAAVWTVAAEDLPDAPDRFDVITCLWNVLGLIADGAKRARALGHMRSLLSPDGRIFLDVHNRYNARAYGWLPALGRACYDQLCRSDTNGDVSFSWRVGDEIIHSRGHVFRPDEISALIEHAGLRVVRRHIVDYQTGTLRRFACEGQLVYEVAAREETPGGNLAPAKEGLDDHEVERPFRLDHNRDRIARIPRCDRVRWQWQFLRQSFSTVSRSGRGRGPQGPRRSA